MSETTIPMTLPLDSDGFLRRECPSCERQFKWRPTQSEETDLSEVGDGDSDTLNESQGANAAPEFYYCPYCYDPGALNAWWTQEQLAYGRELAAAEVLGPELRDLADSMMRLNRSGGLVGVHVDVNMPILSRPEPLTEPDDMVRVDFPCHLDEPLKIDEAWDEEVACLLCGIRYPVDVVRELPALE